MAGNGHGSGGQFKLNSTSFSWSPPHYYFIGFNGMSRGGASRIVDRSEPLAKWKTSKMTNTPLSTGNGLKSDPYLRNIMWNKTHVYPKYAKKNCCLVVQFIIFFGSGNDNSHIFVHVEGNLWVIRSLLHIYTRNIPLEWILGENRPFVTYYLRKRYNSLLYGSKAKKVPVPAAHPY